MKHRLFPSRQICCPARTVRRRETVILALASTIATAGAQLWDSGGANNNWSTAANWNLDTAPVNNGSANITLGNGARTAPNVDIAWNINSLTFQLATPSYAVGGQQLTIQNGGISNNSIALQTVNNSLVLGASQTWNAALGNLTIGTGSSTIANGGNTLIIDGANGTIVNGAISGGGGIIKNGSGTLTIGGSGNTNSYTGTTTVNAGTLVLNKSALSSDIAVTGNLIIGDGTGTDTVRLDANLQIKDSVNVTVNSSGVLNLNGHNDDFTGLTLNGGTVNTGAGTLTLLGDVTTQINGNAATISGNLSLGTMRNFHVASGAAAVDLIIPATITTGGINKDGAGFMRLQGNNTFSLGLTFSGGALFLGSDTAAGTGPMVLNGCLIAGEGGPRTFSNALTLAGDVTTMGSESLTFSGTTTLTGNRTLTVQQNTTFSGAIGENVAGRSLTITGSGVGTSVVTFSGAQANTYTGPTTVNAGTLNLSKTGFATAAVAGQLIVGDGIGGANADVVRLHNSNQLGLAVVTVNSSGLLDLNGNYQATNGITMNGGNITTGAAGELYLNGFSGISTVASSAPSTISGKMTLSDSHENYLTVADGAATNDLDIPANIGGGGFPGAAYKEGPGTLRLSGNNTFNGGLTVKAGTLALGSNQALGASSLYVEGNGSQDYLTLKADGASRTTSSYVSITANTYIAGDKDLTINGSVTLGSAAGHSLAVTNTGKTTFGGYVSVDQGKTLHNTGEGDLFMTGNSYVSGTFNHRAGLLTASGMYVQPGGVFSMDTNFWNYPSFDGTLTNYGTFSHKAGDFLGHINNYGTLDLGSQFTAGNGLTNYTDMTVSAGHILFLNGLGFDNEATTILTGGILAGSGPMMNNGVISGTGTIGGTGGFTNQGVVTQGNGPLNLSNTGANFNYGTITLAAGRQLQMASGATLNNRGALALNSAIVTGSGTLNNQATGTIAGPGTILVSLQNSGVIVPGGTMNVAPSWTNAGLVQLTGPLSNLTGGVINNTGTIQGNGSVGASVTNAGGTIEAVGGTLLLNGTLQNQAGGILAASAGNKLLMGQGLSSNAGFISLTGGTFDNSNKPLINAGKISGYGTLRTGGLTNNGDVTLTGGVTTVTGNITNNVGGQIHVAYDSFLFTGNVVNNGTFKNTDASVTFAGSYTENGTYISDPADNFFNTLTVGENGALNGGLGDRFIIGGDLVTTSRQNGRWQTGLAEIRFEGGDGCHEFGVGGQDFGYSDTGYNNNFAWGIVSMAAGDSLVLMDYDGKGGALYTGVLDLDGGMAQIDSIESNGLNLYYHPALPENAWLGGATYPLQGGGQLAPVPEPRALLLLAAGMMTFLRRRRS